MDKDTYYVVKIGGHYARYNDTKSLVTARLETGAAKFATYDKARKIFHAWNNYFVERPRKERKVVGIVKVTREVVAEHDCKCDDENNHKAAEDLYA